MSPEYKVYECGHTPIGAVVTIAIVSETGQHTVYIDRNKRRWFNLFPGYGCTPIEQFIVGDKYRVHRHDDLFAYLTRIPRYPEPYGLPDGL